MYEENRGKFTVRDIILQLLVVALFIFILIWLFPTKGFISSKVDPLLDRIFNANVMSMKESAESYYTLERLPKNEGDKVKMTLKQMLEKKIILPFSDKYGESCDLDKSYVEVTKKGIEYEMKVNLKCSRQEDYIIVHMGCYDYCLNTICQKEETEIKDSKDQPVKPVRPPYNPDKPNTPDKPDKPEEPKPKKYICEYGLTKNGYYTAWSDWSEFTPTKITVPAGQEKLMEVNTKVETKQVPQEILTGYVFQEVYDGSKPIYEYKNQVAGVREITTTTSCEVVTTTTTTSYSYGDEKFMGTFQTTFVPTAPAGYRFERIDSTVIPCNVNCDVREVLTFKYYAKEVKKTTSTQVETGWKVCDQTVTHEPIVKPVRILIGYEKMYTKTPVYTTAIANMSRTLYQSRTRRFVPGSSELKWSNCNDAGLLSNGWTLTGNKKEV
jgi:hydrogenase maturation factor